MKKYRIVEKGEIVKLGDEFSWYPGRTTVWKTIGQNAPSLGRPCKGGVNQATIRREIKSMQDRIIRAF